MTVRSGPMANPFQRKFARANNHSSAFASKVSRIPLKETMRQARAGVGRWSLALGTPLCLAAILSAQTRPSPTPTPRASGRQVPELTVNVRLVNVFTTVTDEHGAPVSDLKQADFRVLEDGIPQSISVFDRESEMPLSIALAIDTSESTRRDMPLEIASAK